MRLHDAVQLIQDYSVLQEGAVGTIVDIVNHSEGLVYTVEFLPSGQRYSGATTTSASLVGEHFKAARFNHGDTVEFTEDHPNTAVKGDHGKVGTLYPNDHFGIEIGKEIPMGEFTVKGAQLKKAEETHVSKKENQV